MRSIDLINSCFVNDNSRFLKMVLVDFDVNIVIFLHFKLGSYPAAY